MSSLSAEWSSSFLMKASSPSAAWGNPAVCDVETQLNSTMHDSARPTAIVRCVLSGMLHFLRRREAKHGDKACGHFRRVPR